MRLLTSILAGLAAVAIAFALCILLILVLPMAASMVLSRGASGSAGVGAVSFNIGEPPIVAVALVAFAIGFTWRFRRSARTRAR